MASARQVDSKLPRIKAAFHTFLPAAGFLVGGVAETAGVAIVGVTGLLMALSVTAGPNASVIGKAAVAVRKALSLKPGSPEDAAPHRFAEAVGAVFLVTSAALLGLSSFSVLGWGLSLAVVALAALNWLAGICVGCQMYLVLARLRGRVKLASQ